MQQGSSFFSFDFDKFKSSCRKVIRFVEGIKNKIIGHFSQINPETLLDEYVSAVKQNLEAKGVRIHTARMQKIFHGFKVNKDTSSGFLDKKFTITNLYYKNREVFQYQKQSVPIGAVMNMLDHGRRRGFYIPKGHAGNKILVWKYGSGRAIIWNCAMRGRIKSPTKKAVTGVLRDGSGWMEAGSQRLSDLMEKKRIKIKSSMK